MRYPGPQAGINPTTLCKLLLAAFALLCSAVHAQRRYNVWAVGDSLGLDFGKQPLKFFPTAASGITADVRLTSICDTFGDLLFYSDGISVWDARHKVVPKQGTRWPFAGKTIPLAVAHPRYDSAFYLVGVSTEGLDNSLVAVPIALRNNRPNIVYLNGANLPQATPLLRNASMVLAATTHCNGKDTWIVGFADGMLHAFLLTDGGLQPNAVVSNTNFGDKVHTGFSNAKFAANGEVMVLPLVHDNTLAIFDFNNATGFFSLRLRLPVPDTYKLQDVELSPDGSKLYFAIGRTERDPEDEDVTIDRHYIYQADLNAGDAAAVLATLYPVNGAEGQKTACGERRSCAVINRTLQLAPDGRIYANQKLGSKDLYEHHAFIINAPNRTGRQVNYTLGPLTYQKRKYKYFNYNYIRSGSFSLRQNGIQVQAQTCSDQPTSFSLLFNRVDSVRWDFGDPASGEANFSRALRPSHQYTGPGTYGVRAIIYKNCYTDTAYREIEVTRIPSVKIPDLIKDTTVCLGQNFVLDATTPAATGYTWDNGLIYPQRTITQSGTYAVKAFNACSEDERMLTVKIVECPCQAFVPNAFTPNSDGRNDLLRPVLYCGAAMYTFTIYDRYGGIAFRSTTPGQGWNGRYGAMDAANGVYVWTLRYRNPNTGKEQFEKGTVVLMR